MTKHSFRVANSSLCNGGEFVATLTPYHSDRLDEVLTQASLAPELLSALAALLEEHHGGTDSPSVRNARSLIARARGNGGAR